MTSEHLACVLGLAVAATVCGCAAQAQSNDKGPLVQTFDDVQAPGKLTVRWSIDGNTDPSPCNGPATPKFVLTVYDNDSEPIGSYTAECAAFTTTVSLDPGTYSADAALEGRFGTTTVPVKNIEVVSSQDLITPVDFRSGT